MTYHFSPTEPGLYWGKEHGQRQPSVWRVYALSNGSLKAVDPVTNFMRKPDRVEWIAPLTSHDMVLGMMSALQAAKTWWEEYNDPCGEPYSQICAVLAKTNGGV